MSPTGIFYENKMQQCLACNSHAKSDNKHSQNQSALESTGHCYANQLVSQMESFTASQRNTARLLMLVKVPRSQQERAPALLRTTESSIRVCRLFHNRFLCGILSNMRKLFIR